MDSECRKILHLFHYIRSIQLICCFNEDINYISLVSYHYAACIKDLQEHSISLGISVKYKTIPTLGK